MAGSKERRRQKKLERVRQKRASVKERARQQAALRDPRGARRVELVRRGAFGAAWISDDYDELEVPALVTVAVTKRMPGGTVLGHIVLVDRTCLGVKNAMTVPISTEGEFAMRARSLSAGGIRLVPCDPLVAQSVVFHALEYSKELGFVPDPDFERAFLEPRPSLLLETPWARPPRPWYVAGPRDDVSKVLARLSEKVGVDGFDVLAPGLAPFGFNWDDDDENDDEDGELHSPRARAPRLPEAASSESWRAERIDWDTARRGVPTEDVLDGIDLGTASGLQEGVDAIVHTFESLHFLRWEATIRKEQGLPLSAAHEDVLDELLSFSEDPDDDRTLYIDECARPPEPWYATVRRLLPHLLIDRFVTWDSGSASPALGQDLVDVVDAHAAELSSPEGLESPFDVIEPPLRRRFAVQRTFCVLAGLGMEWNGSVISLADPEEGPPRLREAVSALTGQEEALRELGWSGDALFEVLVLPASDRAIFAAALSKRVQGIMTASGA